MEISMNQVQFYSTKMSSVVLDMYYVLVYLRTQESGEVTNEIWKS